MRSAIAISAAALAATSALVAGPARATSITPTEHLKLKLDTTTSPIGFTDIGIEAPKYVPYISVSGTLSGCVAFPNDYSVSATVVQDGVTLLEYAHSSGSGTFGCTNKAGQRVSSVPEIAWPTDTAPAIHPGRVKVTMTIHSYGTDARVSATRWATIPG